MLPYYALHFISFLGGCVFRMKEFSNGEFSFRRVNTTREEVKNSALY